jgi:catechol 2,3-dioxygenase-like lactoylglutathione lyase family enzyme
MENKPLVMRTNHVGFTVIDLDAAIASFESLFGYVLHDRGGRHPRGVELLTGVPGADIEVAHLRHPDLIGIELIAYRAPLDAGKMVGRPCDTGHVHLTFDVADVHAMVEVALGLGFEQVGRIVQSAKVASEGQQVVYLRNADGLTIELIQPPEAALNGT